MACHEVWQCDVCGKLNCISQLTRGSPKQIVRAAKRVFTCVRNLDCLQTGVRAHQAAHTAKLDNTCVLHTSQT